MSAESSDVERFLDPKDELRDVESVYQSMKLTPSKSNIGYTLLNHSVCSSQD